MKILQLIQRPQLRGAEIAACRLAEGLIAAGHECFIVTIFSGENVLPFNGKVLSLEGKQSRRFMDWQAWKQLARIIALERPDIVQANAGDTLKYAVFSKSLFGWKALIVFRNASMVSLYIKSWWTRSLNRMLYSSTAHIVSVSKHSRRDFLSLFPEVSDKISNIPVGYSNEQSLNVTREKKNDKSILLHVGGFTFEKNHEGLLRIFSLLLKERNNDVMLWLVGDGPLRTNIEKLVGDASLTEHVTFWGYRPDPHNFYAQADVFVLPSIIEGMPSVILEAFNYKLPVVSYDAGGVSELINEQTGWLVAKGDEQQFVRAINDALDDDSKRQMRSANGFRLLKSAYTMDDVVQSFVNCYNQVIEKKK